MLVTFGAPTSAEVAALAARCRGLPLSCPGPGLTREAPPRGWSRDAHSERLGEGEPVFLAAVAALRRWAQFRLGWTEPLDGAALIERDAFAGAAFALGPLRWLLPCRIVEVIDAPRRFGFSYATLPGHIERGEERFTVEWRADGSIWYEILAVSRPGHWLAWVGYPIVRLLQARFRRDSGAAMQRAVDTGAAREDAGRSRSIAAIGGLVWIATLAAHPWLGELRPLWPTLLLLFAALVIVPLGLPLAQRRASAFTLFAALCFGTACALPRGPLAAALSAPWLLEATRHALAGLARALRRKLLPIESLAADVALIYLAVGAGWAFLDRLGAQPLNFDLLVIHLTAIHFHFAGFALLVLSARAAQALGGLVPKGICAALILGMPLVATGITLTHLGHDPRIEAAAAAIFAGSGLASAGMHLRLALRAGSPAPSAMLFSIAGLSLAAGMVFAFLYGVRTLLPQIEGLTVPLMWAAHGSLNALGFALGGMLAWIEPGARGANGRPARSSPASTQSGKPARNS